MNNKISHNCFCIIVNVFSLLLSLAVIQKCNAITTAFTVNTQQQLLQIPEDTEVKLDTETSLNGYQNYYVTVPNSITVLYFQIYSSHKFTFYIKQGSAPTKTIYDKEISITEKEGDDYTTKIDFDIIKSSTFSLNKDKRVVEDNYHIYFKVAGVSASVKIRTQDNELYWWYFLPIPILFYILIVVCLFVIVAQYIITKKKKNKKNNSQNDGNESVDEKLTLNGNNINNKGGYSQI